jgi:hypothetical protein
MIASCLTLMLASSNEGKRCALRALFVICRCTC